MYKKKSEGQNGTKEMEKGEEKKKVRWSISKMIKVL